MSVDGYGCGEYFIWEQVAARLKLEADTLSPILIRRFCGLEDAMRSHLQSVTLHRHQQRNLEVIILSSSILKVLKVDGFLAKTFFVTTSNIGDLIQLRQQGACYGYR